MAIWIWLKKYWKWVLFPVGALLWLATRRRTVQVTSSEREGQARVEAEATTQAADKLERARRTRDGEVSRVEKRIDAELDKLDASARAEAERLKEDPQALNDFLRSVGKDVRGD